MKLKFGIPIFIAFFLLLIAGISSLDSDIETLSKIRTAIVVNQVGYLPQWQKTALIINSQNPTERVELIDADTSEPVTSLNLEQAVKNSGSRDTLSSVDFSSVVEPGKYYLKQSNIESVPFEIGTDIYQEPLISLLRSYSLQRCGVEVDDPVTGISHAPCHLQDASIVRRDPFYKAGYLLETTGGWHNGEGYNKYTTTTTVTIARLLNLYSSHSDLFPDRHLNIPESGNGIADLLDETKFGLDWLLKMQSLDGAVYRKIAGEEWVTDVPPEEDFSPRYVYGISTADTAKFAATMAIASRTYKAIDAQLAAKYLQGAKLAWQYLDEHPKTLIDWAAKDDRGSISYIAAKDNREKSRKTDLEDRLWAAAELYITTGKQTFDDYFVANLNLDDYDGVFSWKNPLSLALTDYINQNSQSTTEELTSKIKAAIQQQAEVILNRVRQSPYDIANDRFIENSNQITIEEGITLIRAYQLTDNRAYFDAAVAQLNYILGRNYFDQTFITGIGTNPVQNINNVMAIVKKVNIPGLLVGGPNSDTNDGMVAQNKGQLSYIDDKRSYATNQYKIDNNASLVTLITELISQQ